MTLASFLQRFHEAHQQFVLREVVLALRPAARVRVPMCWNQEHEISKKDQNTVMAIYQL